jgi:hypothetical protein
MKEFPTPQEKEKNRDSRPFLSAAQDHVQGNSADASHPSRVGGSKDKITENFSQNAPMNKKR